MSSVSESSKVASSFFWTSRGYCIARNSNVLRRLPSPSPLQGKAGSLFPGTYAPPAHRSPNNMATLTIPIQLTDPELKLLQTLVYQECGMFFDERRSHFLKDRLQRRLKVCQLDSFYSYYRLLTSREGKAELATHAVWERSPRKFSSPKRN